MRTVSSVTDAPPHDQPLLLRSELRLLTTSGPPPAQTSVQNDGAPDQQYGRVSLVVEAAIGVTTQRPWFVAMYSCNSPTIPSRVQTPAAQ
jgi:hypothetical protein